MATRRRDWYRLDNAATIYPASTRLENTNVFRIAATLKQPIEPAVLARALELTLPRFPGFAVTLHRGAFWNYLEANGQPPKVLPEAQPPCGIMLPRENNGYCFRVLYFGCRIALETYHVLADGTGAEAFLRSLIFHYLTQCGLEVGYDESILNAHIPIAAEELEDAFQRYAHGAPKGPLHSEREAYHIGGLLAESGAVRVIHASMPAKQALATAKASGATLTEYLVAIFGHAIIESYHPATSSLPLRIQVPVNLRRFFPSKTLRNFSSYLCVGIPPDADFEGCLEAVRAQMRRDANPDEMKRRFAANVGMQRNPFLRVAPLPFKSFVLRRAFHRYGERQMTATLSNLGVITLPPGMAEHVERFDMVLPSSAWLPVNIAVCSYAGSLNIAFSRVIEETEVERRFCRFLIQHGLTITTMDNGGDAP